MRIQLKTKMKDNLAIFCGYLLKSDTTRDLTQEKESDKEENFHDQGNSTPLVVHKF